MRGGSNGTAIDASYLLVFTIISDSESNWILFWCVLNCILSCFYSNMCEIHVWDCIECDVAVLDEVNVVEGLWETIWIGWNRLHVGWITGRCYELVGCLAFRCVVIYICAGIMACKLWESHFWTLIWVVVLVGWMWCVGVWTRVFVFEHIEYIGSWHDGFEFGFGLYILCVDFKWDGDGGCSPWGDAPPIAPPP